MTPHQALCTTSAQESITRNKTKRQSLSLMCIWNKTFPIYGNEIEASWRCWNIEDGCVVLYLVVVLSRSGMEGQGAVPAL